jgi:sugar phosphate isomerase/epimerase
MNKKIYNYITLLLIVISIGACQSLEKKELKTAKNTWPISSYNFGGMENMSVEEQVALLRKSGYQGITLRIAKDIDFKNLPDFLSEADKFDDFSINALFVRYNFDDSVERRESWTDVVDQIAGKNIQLWVIFGKKVEGYGNVFVENKLREIVDYAKQKEVEVVLYPHSSCFFESAEEGMPLVEKINDDNLKIAFHLYHEVRAKNGHRIHEVLNVIEHKLGAVTLAGTDSVADYSSPRTRDTSTIKPLGEGTFDLKQFALELNKTEYSGYIGLMNFHLKEAPEVYLPRSKGIWDSYFNEQ